MSENNFDSNPVNPTSDNPLPPPPTPPIASGQPAPAQPMYGAGYAQPIPDQKSKMVAGILGILLGSLGVHNFYLGFTGKAVAQLLISILSLGFLAPVSAVWGLIEGILILIAQPGTQWSFDAKGLPLAQ